MRRGGGVGDCEMERIRCNTKDYYVTEQLRSCFPFNCEYNLPALFHDTNCCQLKFNFLIIILTSIVHNNNNIMSRNLLEITTLEC